MPNQATKYLKMPGRNATTLVRETHGAISNISGKGIGNVLLDGGLGTTSSYSDMSNYLDTTNWTSASRSKATPFKGKGLNDKIGSSLANLNIEKPAAKKLRKNINFSL